MEPAAGRTINLNLFLLFTILDISCGTVRYECIKQISELCLKSGTANALGFMNSDALVWSWVMGRGFFFWRTMGLGSFFLWCSYSGDDFVNMMIFLILFSISIDSFVCLFQKKRAFLEVIAG